MALREIETFIIVMLENRSFDHACGYLSLPDADPPLMVEGLRNDPTWLGTFDNDDHDGTPKRIYRLDPHVQNITDPVLSENHIRA
jgi:phospholipase C